MFLARNKAFWIMTNPTRPNRGCKRCSVWFTHRGHCKRRVQLAQAASSASASAMSSYSLSKSCKTSWRQSSHTGMNDCCHKTCAISPGAAQGRWHACTALHLLYVSHGRNPSRRLRNFTDCDHEPRSVRCSGTRHRYTLP